ncbi:MAG: STAS/SEC14 domain-containing protein [Jiangellales bacterium]
MIEELSASHDHVLGFRVSGDITKEDYDVLTPAVATAAQNGSVRLLLDLTDFRWEKVDAWGADLHFGHEFHDAIERMAIVGDHAWEKYLARMAQPFYAREARFFSTGDEAWAWMDAN